MSYSSIYDAMAKVQKECGIVYGKKTHIKGARERIIPPVRPS